MGLNPAVAQQGSWAVSNVFDASNAIRAKRHRKEGHPDPAPAAPPKPLPGRRALPVAKPPVKRPEPTEDASIKPHQIERDRWRNVRLQRKPCPKCLRRGIPWSLTGGLWRHLNPKTDEPCQ